MHSDTRRFPRSFIPEWMCWSNKFDDHESRVELNTNLPPIEMRDRGIKRMILPPNTKLIYKGKKLTRNVTI